jgi:hypothetical protein
MRPILISVIRQIVVKFCVALAFAATLALASNSSLELGLRYFAAISLLIGTRRYGDNSGQRRPRDVIVLGSGTYIFYDSSRCPLPRRSYGVICLSLLSPFEAV